jgi:hypothetical protein
MAENADGISTQLVGVPLDMRTWGDRSHSQTIVVYSGAFSRRVLPVGVVSSEAEED